MDGPIFVPAQFEFRRLKTSLINSISPDRVYKTESKCLLPDRDYRWLERAL